MPNEATIGDSPMIINPGKNLLCGHRGPHRQSPNNPSSNRTVDVTGIANVTEVPSLHETEAFVYVRQGELTDITSPYTLFCVKNAAHMMQVRTGAA